MKRPAARLAVDLLQLLATLLLVGALFYWLATRPKTPTKWTQPPTPADLRSIDRR